MTREIPVIDISVFDISEKEISINKTELAQIDWDLFDRMLTEKQPFQIDILNLDTMNIARFMYQAKLNITDPRDGTNHVVFQYYPIKESRELYPKLEPYHLIFRF